MAVVASVAFALWRFAYVLWVCRVGVISVALGGVLLAYTVQARDLFADLGLAWWHWLIFFLLVFAWAWIVHASARRALQHDDWLGELRVLPASPQRRLQLQELYWYPALWIPRLLSLAIFVFVGFAIVRTRVNLVGAAPDLPEAARAVSLAWMLLAGTAAVALAYVLLIWKRRRLGDWILPTGGWSHQPPLLAGTAPVFASILPPYYTRPTPPVPRELVDRALSITRLVVLALLIFTIAEPHFFAARGPRLFFVPILLGGAVVLLGELAAWSMRWRTPLLLVLVAVSFIAVFLTESFHDTRWMQIAVPPSKAAGDKRQIALEEAVARWKIANKCTSSCPRPILIAGQGGASRAGFYTASVVGALIDLGLDKEKGATYGDLRSRIFALSTVSGSSAGAVVMRAALLDAAERATEPNEANRPPCRTAGHGSWFGKALMAQDRRYDPTRSWRDCFQAIMAGDFLSPIFVALAYRDNFPFINPVTKRPAWSDRAVLLEQALERRYHAFTTGNGTDTGDARSCPDQPRSLAEDTTGLCRPFGYHPHPDRAGIWVPLFFINGASVFTGRRIVVGDVNTADSYGPDRTFMALAYDLNDLRTSERKRKPRTVVEKGTDIRLSTAATMSARFPVISPQGLIRNLDGNVDDQIVDGGYFENDGLVTIIDIAAALRERFGLNPVVIHVVNEPALPTNAGADSQRPPPPVAVDRSPFDDIFAIARALIAARSGHVDQYMTALKSLTGGSRVYEIGVHPITPDQAMSPENNPICRHRVTAGGRMERVSMSWWMSQPVQAYLDAQLCLRSNWVRLECELHSESSAPGNACATNRPE